MKAIKDKKQLLKLIPWFKASRYKNIENASLEYIYEELALRFFVMNGLSTGKPNLELQASLLSEREPYNSGELISCPDENVSPMCGLDIVYIAKQLHEIKPNLISTFDTSFLHEIKDIHNHSFDGAGVCVGISLSHATDNEIVEELARLIKKLRVELDVPEPERPKTAKGQDHRKLFHYGVFEYLDLTLWAQIYGYTLKLSFIADLISHRQLITYDYLRKNTLSYVKKAMTFEYLEQFTADIKNFK